MAGGEYDFVVLGGGHNGLLSTAYLAKAGFKVCCLEATDEFGGGTKSAEVTAPGYISDIGGMCHNMISKTPIVTQDELGLMSKYGLEYVQAESMFGTVFPDNTYLAVDVSLDQTCQNIAQFSEKDAEAYVKFHEYMGKMLAVAGIGAQSPVPPYGSMMNAMSMSPEGREFQRVLNSSAQQILEEWFESEQVRVTFSRWCTEMMIDPRQIGTATLLYFTTTVHNPETVCSPVPKGGCASFVKALVECCKDAGADLFTNAYVDTITTAGGEAKTVRTKNGDEFKAKNAIVSTINVKDVYDYLGDDAPAEEADYARKLKYSDFAALNQSFALKKEPEFKAGPGVKRMFNLESAPWEKEYLQTFSNYTLGEFSPHLPNITMPYINDPSRCPAGQAVMNIYTYAPYKLWGDEKNWETHGQELMDQVWDHVKGMTTNITDDDIIGRWGFTPVDYEKWNPAMHNGDIAMIGMQPSQLYDMRPFPGKGHLYHGDIENLYIIGTCGHPGAGIAASARAGIQTVLDDFGVDFRDVVKK